MSEEKKPLNFIEHIVEEDLTTGMSKENLRFRFPPEPNGYLHIGHTKAIGISFGLGLKYNAPVNLRFDDTNPAKEEQEYVDAIKEDITWLGYQWDKECYSSDYFQQLYDWTVELIKDGKAYVDSQSAETIASQKGTTTEPGTNSPYRDRSVEENLELFQKMKEGKFDEGDHVVRAKIDMADPNMLMRDPLMYRILKKSHHRTGDDWCIYPMYDWTHGESDYIENISHSLCSLEFKPHRKLYDWFLDQVYSTNIRPKQREFARLNLSYTIMSKRKLLKLVEEGVVSGWDDPRMPTISALRRRGYTPASIRKFVETVGVAKRENVIDVSLLEFCVREDLNKTAPRVMAVLDPVKLVITNYPKGEEEWLEAENNPEDEAAGSRKIPFSGELYIEREDFKEEAGRKFFRLTLGKEVRLKNAYIIKGERVIKDAEGNITEIQCAYDPKSKSGSGTEESKRNVKGTLHWVSISHAIPSEVRIYDRLFNDEAPDSHKDKDFVEFLNPDSLKIITGYVEPSLKDVKLLDQFQFQRLGYFNVDIDSAPGALVFNKTVGLRDTWAKVKPVPTNQDIKKQPQNQQKAILPIEEIKRAGKKYTNVPDIKREGLKIKIIEAAKTVEIEELVPLYETAVKKAGTRIATMIALSEILKNKGIQPDQLAKDFITKALEDKNELLQLEAQKVASDYDI
ncbi:glutaminyl-tRNA synthetase [Aquimarina sp. EL_43]|uniref:glutamine--tRNA ligase/YqeY domain fusion protein n=1 Tax=unclassified Aquimarina TaxID=2627091 RepID=UPI0018CAB38D|nr:MULTISPECIES: glutamine--tRNA ligase/YqeY domain fusion protein [unclassified Aquimarina]MBG6133071.1 glutaminyl-tRNA synthetase [Aquimarina sp. EL_35]MBG6153229.1 glutaminyl-tRNA synthetase [Aquimarina sp. EL_32]MBG6171502.1 glutaminyl-tRNA synthetase [Aquimarina sp. EL_43]